MRFVIQYTSEPASIHMPELDITRTINHGAIIYMGVHKNDVDDYQGKIDKFVRKIQTVKLFTGPSGNIDSSLNDIQGQIILISNFTLYSRNKKGSSVDYCHSAPYAQAQDIYQHCVQACQDANIPTQTGEFGAKMHITATITGPINHLRDF